MTKRGIECETIESEDRALHALDFGERRDVVLTDDDIAALGAGKALKFDDGECVTFITLDEG